MDQNFIKKATDFTKFNFMESDFTDNKYQKEIRHLFNTYYFPTIDLNALTMPVVNKQNINKAIDKLTATSSSRFKDLYAYKDLGFGSGEVLMFLLVDGAKLGGKKSAGADLYVNGKMYEIKDAEITSDNKYARNFKVGGTFSVSDIIDELDDLRRKLNLAGNKSVINTSVFDTMKEKAAAEFDSIEKKFGKLLYDNYFKRHESIIFDKKSGKIHTIKVPKPEEIKLHVLTQNVLKPQIKI